MEMKNQIQALIDDNETIRFKDNAGNIDGNYDEIFERLRETGGDDFILSLKDVIMNANSANSAAMFMIGDIIDSNSPLVEQVMMEWIEFHKDDSVRFYAASNLEAYAQTRKITVGKLKNLYMNEDNPRVKAKLRVILCKQEAENAGFVCKRTYYGDERKRINYDLLELVSMSKVEQFDRFFKYDKYDQEQIKFFIGSKYVISQIKERLRKLLKKSTRHIVSMGFNANSEFGVNSEPKTNNEIEIKVI